LPAIRSTRGDHDAHGSFAHPQGRFAVTAAPPVMTLVDALRSTDPHPELARLRERGTHRSGNGSVVVSSYAAAVDALGQPWLRSSLPRGARQPGGAARGTANRALIFLDGADHERMRPIMARALHADPGRLAAGIETRIAGSRDLVGDVLWPAVGVVMTGILGLPERLADDIRRWGRDCSDLLDLDPRADLVPIAMRSMMRLFAEVRRTAEAGDAGGVLAALLREHDAGVVSWREVMCNIVSLLTAGLDTTIGLITNGLCVLHDQPHLVPGPAADRRRWVHLVDEVARYDSPAQVTVRFAAEDGILDGCAVRRHDLVLVLLGAANRDPAVFAAPDTFDPSRSGPDHLGFGAGAHRCLGMAIGRAAAARSLAAICRARPVAAFDYASARRRPHCIFRSFDSVPVAPA
jgi:cytochrome P450